MESVIVAAFIMAGICQVWFWRLHTREQRSLWYGLSFLFAVGTAFCAVEVWLWYTFPFDGHPILGNVNLFVVVVFVAALLALPIALVVTLIFSGIRLIRREGASPRNMLSLGLGILLVAYVAVWPAVRQFLVGIPVLGQVLDVAFGFAAILLGIAGVAFTLYTVSGLLAQVPHPRRHYQHIVVLGAGLMPDGTVTPLLARRVERGVAMWQRNPGSVLIMSGGQGPDEAVPEAVAMRNYALSLGVPSESILLERRSRNTQQNLQLSARLLPDGSSGERVLIVTDDYHVFRALLISRALGLAADGVGSHVRLYFSLNALVREWIAYVSLRRSFYLRLTVALLVVYLLVCVAMPLLGSAL